MSTPTLRRRLREEGTSFREIRDDVLHQAATTSLARSNEPVATLSYRPYHRPCRFRR